MSTKLATLISSIALLSISSVELLNDVNTDQKIASFHAGESAVSEVIYELNNNAEDALTQLKKEVSAGKRENLQYDDINDSLNIGYFDLEVSPSVTNQIDLGDVTGGDVSFIDIPPKDYFNTFEINYNQGNKNDHLMIQIAKYKDDNDFNICNFDDYDKSECDNIEVAYINTSDVSLNKKYEKGYLVELSQGDELYNNKAILKGFNTNTYNYRISFNTISGDKTQLLYYVTHNGNKKNMVNNFVEIDVVGNSKNNYDRIKIQKNIVEKQRLMNHYVNITNNEISK